MEIVKQWDYTGWKKYAPEDTGHEQFDWNSTILTSLNFVTHKSGIGQGEVVNIRVPEHLKEVVEFPLEVNGRVQGLYLFEVTYVDTPEDTIEVNGKGLEIINFKN